MEIIIEYVLIENLLINLIVLKTTALLTKEKGRFFLLTSFLCACLTVSIPIFYLSTIGSFLVEIGVVILSVCLSFKFHTFKKFLQLFLCLFVVLFLYGGACYFFESLFGVQSILIVLGVVIFVFLLVKFLTKRIQRKKSIDNFCFEVSIENNGKTTSWKGFLDSGNMLFDPLTERPITLINFKVFSSLFEGIDLQDIFFKSDKLKVLKYAHYIKFNTLGEDNKMLVFQVEKLRVNGHDFEKQTLGLSLKNFDAVFGTDIILHNNFAGIWMGGCYEFAL